ncbi:MAG: NusG domain II-containing protein [Faecalibacterium prausnitzii]
MEEKCDLCTGGAGTGRRYFSCGAGAAPAKGSGLQAVVDFGDGVTETLPLAQDHDYLYEVGDYIVHLQVKDGAIAFLDSQCPDHVCEQFGWLDKDGAWAACVPAGVYVVVEPITDAG